MEVWRQEAAIKDRPGDWETWPHPGKAGLFENWRKANKWTARKRANWLRDKKKAFWLIKRRGIIWTKGRVSYIGDRDLT